MHLLLDVIINKPTICNHTNAEVTKPVHRLCSSDKLDVQSNTLPWNFSMAEPVRKERHTRPWITDTCPWTAVTAVNLWHFSVNHWYFCYALLTFYRETLVLYEKSLTLYHLLSVYHDPWIPDTNTCFWIFCLALSVIGERLTIYLESHCKYGTACYQENDWHFILILLYSTASCREEIKKKKKL